MTHVYMHRLSAIIGSGNGMSPLPQLVLNSKEQMYVGETEKLFEENYIWKNVVCPVTALLSRGLNQLKFLATSINSIPSITFWYDRHKNEHDR